MALWFLPCYKHGAPMALLIRAAYDENGKDFIRAECRRHGMFTKKEIIV